MPIKVLGLSIMLYLVPCSKTNFQSDAVQSTACVEWTAAVSKTVHYRLHCNVNSCIYITMENTKMDKKTGERKIFLCL